MRPAILIIIALFALMGSARAATDMACVSVATWLNPVSRASLDAPDVLARAAQGSILLLGESHDNADHHLWQLQTIAALHARGRPITLGFEMFPRRVQPALDAWVAGDYDKQGFFDATDWDRVWGFDPALYMALFDFARINRVPMVALNVERSLIAAIRDQGWDAVPEDQREGVTDPAPPSPKYRASLEAVYDEHLERAESAQDPVGLKRFIAAQQTWDRAMAQALDDVGGESLVIAIIGGGHVENRWGVAHQLVALGRDDVSVLMPWDIGRDCDELTADFADAVFGLDPPVVVAGDAPWRPRLGVVIMTVTGVLRVIEVVPGSVAESAGLLADDVIVTAAGQAVVESGDLVAIIGRQAPGTWLPLVIDRSGETLDITAKFAPAP